MNTCRNPVTDHGWSFSSRSHPAGTMWKAHASCPERPGRGLYPPLFAAVGSADSQHPLVDGALRFARREGANVGGVPACAHVSGAAGVAQHQAGPSVVDALVA